MPESKEGGPVFDPSKPQGEGSERADQSAESPPNTGAKGSPNHPQAAKGKDQPYPDAALNDPKMARHARLYDRVKAVVASPPTIKEISGWSEDERAEVEAYLDRAHLGMGDSRGAQGAVAVEVPAVLKRKK